MMHVVARCIRLGCLRSSKEVPSECVVEISRRRMYHCFNDNEDTDVRSTDTEVDVCQRKGLLGTISMMLCVDALLQSLSCYY